MNTQATGVVVAKHYVFVSKKELEEYYHGNIPESLVLVEMNGERGAYIKMEPNNPINNMGSRVTLYERREVALTVPDDPNATSSNTTTSS